MGCDVHMHAEVRNNKGIWEKVGRVFDNPYYSPERETEVFEDGYVFNSPKTDEPYEGRNYALFAILADVRNGFGFTGATTHEPVSPLFANRGVPEDSSEEYKNIVAGWDCDGHSHTYAYLNELEAVDWDSIVINRTGFITAKEYERVISTGTNPEYWCGDVGGGFIRKVTPEAYENNYRNAVATIDDRISVYVQWFWQETMTEALGNFITDTIPALKKLGYPKDVRIVFFFDS